MPMNFIFGNYNKISGTTHVKAIKGHDFPNWLLFGNNRGYLLYQRNSHLWTKNKNNSIGLT